eukprot:12956914-Alexandrium_andersonii.AAC.1
MLLARAPQLFLGNHSPGGGRFQLQREQSGYIACAQHKIRGAVSVHFEPVEEQGGNEAWPEWCENKEIP